MRGTAGCSSGRLRSWVAARRIPRWRCRPGQDALDRYRREQLEAIVLAIDRIEHPQGLDGTVLIVGISLQILTLVLCGAITLRQRRRLQVSVGHPIEGLLAAVHRIEAGEYPTMLPVDGPRELRALAEGMVGRAGVHGTVFLEIDGNVRRVDDGTVAAGALALPMVGGGRPQAVIELGAHGGGILRALGSFTDGRAWKPDS